MELVVNTVDLNGLTIEAARLKVDGQDTIDGHDSLKATLTAIENPAQRTTLWLDPQTKRAFQSEQVLPAMGNAVLSKRLVR